MKPFFKLISTSGTAQSGPVQGRGFALISTLLIIAVLTIMVVAFMQSMRIDRLTARSYLSKQQAEMAANAGVVSAQTYLFNLISTNTYYATGYTNVPAGQVSPVFMGATNATNTPTLRYLISTPNPLVAPVFDSTNSIDLNKMPGRTGGWLGSPMIAGNLVTTTNKAMWINILKDPSRPMQPNKSQPLYNPVVSRYAYWIEDETAKIDVGKVGNAGPTGAFQRSTNNFGITNIDLGALPLSNKAPLAVDESVINKQMIDTRAATFYLPYDTGLINRLAYPGESNTNVWNDVRFHATPYSLSNELSAKARRRININAIVTNVNPGDTGANKKIAADLDDIAFAISGYHPLKGLLSLSNSDGGLFLDKAEEDGMLKDFGKRFYRNPTMPAANTTPLKANHEKTYLLRLAANVRDYIDSDSLPTVVDYSGNIVYGTRPALSWSNGTEPVALGKEAVPVLQEHAIRFLMTNVAIEAGTNPSNRRKVSFNVDLWLEFYNPSTKDYIAPAGTKLKIYSLPPFVAQQYPLVELQDFELDLEGDVFPAGKTVVITTSPSTASDPSGMILDPSTLIRKTDTAKNTLPRVYTDRYGNYQVGGGTGTARTFGIRMQGRAAILDTDYSIEMLMSNPNGYIDGFPFIGIPGTTTATVEMTSSEDGTKGTWNITPASTRDKRLIWSASMKGNDGPSRSGDGRSMSEPLELVSGSNSAYGPDQGRFFGNIQGNGVIPNTATFGRAALSYITPTGWPDYNPALNDTKNTSYEFIRDGVMDSIGELGNIYDPHRKYDTTFAAPATAIRYARGGGRTLKIGQPDDLIGTVRFAAANTTLVGWFNAAWRLTDIFYAGPTGEQMAPATAEGKLNINGVLRDQGVAFKALLRKFTFSASPEGDTARANNTLSDADMDKLITSIRTYLTANGPMMERGELSQVPFFSAAGTANQAGGRESSTVNDRSREEIFRRIMELITTRSASFTVYCIGEAVTQKSSGEIQRVAVSKERVSFTITPQIGNGLLDTATSYILNNYAETSE